MGKVIMSGIVPLLTVPGAGTPLSAFAEGSIIKINEDSSPVEFYVAKHDYEQGLNGAGRTLVVRKNCTKGNRQWNSSNANAYASSTINSWLNGDYKNLLDPAVQTLIGTTKFYYTIGNGSSKVGTLERSVFLLSLAELGTKYSYANDEGTALSIASILKPAYNDYQNLVNQWCRTVYWFDTTTVTVINSAGDAATSKCKNYYYPRPCFTLPANTEIDDNGLVVA